MKKMNHKIIITIFLGLIALISCNRTTTQKDVSNTKSSNDEGLALMKTNCFSCHSPNANFENRLAPPMIAIKKHYITEGVSKKQFVKELSEYVKKPSAEKSKMPGAVNRFGLMPVMAFTDKQLKTIAEYIYDNEIESPAWFESHFNEDRAKYMNSLQGSQSYEAIGMKHAMSAKAVLGKNLMQTIASKGTDEALVFCNINAIPLIDSIGNSLNVNIKRVSDKPRNSNNQANEAELAYIEMAKMAMSKNEVVRAKVTEINGRKIGYYPIETNKMCLQCHGKTDSDIKPSTVEKIGKLYPNDKATGYGENQIRGIFVVDMAKK